VRGGPAGGILDGKIEAALPPSPRNIAITWLGLSPLARPIVFLRPARQFVATGTRGRDRHPETDAAVIARALATATLLAERTRYSASFQYSPST